MVDEGRRHFFRDLVNIFSDTGDAISEASSLPQEVAESYSTGGNISRRGFVATAATAAVLAALGLGSINCAEHNRHQGSGLRQGENPSNKYSWSTSFYNNANTGLAVPGDNLRLTVTGSPYTGSQLELALGANSPVKGDSIIIDTSNFKGGRYTDTLKITGQIPNVTTTGSTTLGLEYVVNHMAGYFSEISDRTSDLQKDINGMTKYTATEWTDILALLESTKDQVTINDSVIQLIKSNFEAERDLKNPGATIQNVYVDHNTGEFVYEVKDSNGSTQGFTDDTFLGYVRHNIPDSDAVQIAKEALDNAAQVADDAVPANQEYAVNLTARNYQNPTKSGDLLAECDVILDQSKPYLDQFATALATHQTRTNPAIPLTVADLAALYKQNILAILNDGTISQTNVELEARPVTGKYGMALTSANSQNNFQYYFNKIVNGLKESGSRLFPLLDSTETTALESVFRDVITDAARNNFYVLRQNRMLSDAQARDQLRRQTLFY